MSVGSRALDLNGPTACQGLLLITMTMTPLAGFVIISVIVVTVLPIIVGFLVMGLFPLTIRYMLYLPVANSIVIRNPNDLCRDITVFHGDPRSVVCLGSVPPVAPWRPPEPRVEKEIWSCIGNEIDPRPWDQDDLGGFRDDHGWSSYVDVKVDLRPSVFLWAGQEKNDENHQAAHRCTTESHNYLPIEFIFIDREPGISSAPLFPEMWFAGRDDDKKGKGGGGVGSENRNP